MMAVTRTPQLQLLTIFYLLLILISSSHQCGPGRNYGTRKARKMTPLVFKQHVPNVSENTLGASGPSEGRITRQDPRFKDLVVNNNPNIIFKDEEGTGVDRIMSQRCRDKLDALAILVRNHWPGVRLRVIEVWDETDHSPQESLHFEGRAADVTTSDRDRSKYGMLARLAVNAGFDWVYYESRGYIHCSVRSDSSIAVQAGGCFPGSSTVQLETHGTLPLSQLSVGDRVLTVTPSGAFRYEPVIAFLHRVENVTALVHSVETETGQKLTVTPDHLVYASEDRTSGGLQDVLPTFAGHLRPNESYVYVRADDGGSSATGVVRSRVTKVTVGQSSGLYAPLTDSGTIVVDDTLTSCYAYVNSHALAHLTMTPLRLKHRATELLGSIFGTTPAAAASGKMLLFDGDGVNGFAKVLYNIGIRILPSCLWFTTDSSSYSHELS